MRKFILFLLVINLSPIEAAEFAVVVSSKNQLQHLEAKKVRDLFLKKRSFAGKQKLFPVNLLGQDKIRTTFEEKVLQMQREEINHYWINNHFQGISPPITQASLNSIKLFIERVDGAIGYLPLNMVNADLKVIYEF